MAVAELAIKAAAGEERAARLSVPEAPAVISRTMRETCHFLELAPGDKVVKRSHCHAVPPAIGICTWMRAAPCVARGTPEHLGGERGHPLIT